VKGEKIATGLRATEGIMTAGGGSFYSPLQSQITETILSYSHLKMGLSYRNHIHIVSLIWSIVALGKKSLPSCFILG